MITPNYLSFLFFKKFSTLFFLKQFGYLLKLIFYYLLAKKFSQEDVGIFFFNFTLLTILGVISRLGLDIIVPKKISQFISKNQITACHCILKKTTLITFSSSIFLLLIFSCINFNFFQIKNFYLPLLIFLPFFSLIPLLSNFYKSLNKQHLSIIFEIISTYFVLTFLLVFNHNINFDNFIFYFGFTLIFSLFFFLFFLPFRFINTRYLTFKRRNFSFKESLSYLVYSLLSLGMGSIDILMLNQLGSPEYVATYSIALKIALLISFGLSIINSMMYPIIPPLLVIGDFIKIKFQLLRFSLLAACISIPLLLLVFFFPNQILLFFGDSYAAGANSLVILSIYQFINILTAGISFVLILSVMRNKLIFILFISFIINIILNYLLIPTFGVDGCAIATSLSSLIGLILSLIAYIDLTKNNKRNT